MVYIHLPGQHQPVQVDSIVWLKSEANYTWVYFLDGSSKIISQPLGWFEKKLDFIRIHRSSLANPVHVKHFSQKKSRTGSIELVNGMTLMVSRNRLEHTVTRLKQTSGLSRL